jgi:hypothetical protein
MDEHILYYKKINLFIFLNNFVKSIIIRIFVI